MRFKVVPIPINGAQDAPLTLVQNQNVNASVAGPTVDPWNASVNTGIDPFLADIDPLNAGDGSYTLNTTVNGNPRVLTLNELFDAYGRLTQMLGTDTPVAGKLGQPLRQRADRERQQWRCGDLGDPQPHR